MSWARAACQLRRARGSRHGWGSRVPTHSPVGFLWTRGRVEATVLKEGRRGPPLTEGESPGLTIAPRGRGQRVPPCCPLAGSLLDDALPSSFLTPPALSLPSGPGFPQGVGPTWKALGFSRRDPTNQRPLNDGPRSTTPGSTAAPPGPRTVGVPSDPCPGASTCWGPAPPPWQPALSCRSSPREISKPVSNLWTGCGAPSALMSPGVRTQPPSPQNQ